MELAWSDGSCETCETGSAGHSAGVGVVPAPWGGLSGLWCLKTGPKMNCCCFHL